MSTIKILSPVVFALILTFGLVAGLALAVEPAALILAPEAIILYVDADASGEASGLSWTDAYTTLQDALAAASSGAQIWVAEGVYYPDEGSGQTDNNRYSTFAMAEGVALYGGFAGTEAFLDERDWESHATVLSGDIGGDDITDPQGVVTSTAGIVGDNAYHVVFSQAVTETAILDGFSITAGQANSGYPENFGGGMKNDQSSPTLANVTISGNSAYFGGGMYNYQSSPTLTDVTFSSNTAGEWGGGMYNCFYSSPTLTNVAFSGNTAGAGGGMFNYSDSSPTLTNVAFSGNSAVYYGGGMDNLSSSPTLTDVTFSSNTAGEWGGGMYNDNSSPELTDVIFSGNTAVGWAGGMYSVGNSNPILMNIIFDGNSAESGAGMFIDGGGPTLVNVEFSKNHADINGGGLHTHNGSDATLTNVTFIGNSAESEGGGIYNLISTLTLTNTIVWGNSAELDYPQIANNGGSVAVSYSDIQGCGYSDAWVADCGTDGGGNIDADPLFVDATVGNLRLQSNSPAIDAGDNAAIPIEFTTDLDGSPRFTDIDTVPNSGSGEVPIVDMGAYEAQPGSDIIYVDMDAAGPLHDGTTWETAFLTLQAGLAAADVGDQIWVAQGVYVPGPAGNRAARFSLKDGVALYGGFVGTEGSLDERDWESRVTVLSGDIDENDITDPNGVVTSTTGIMGANAYHVVYSQAVTETAILDGFSITAGRADDSYSDNCGGGMENIESSPTLNNMSFTANSAFCGGGMSNEFSNPILTNVTFSGNLVDLDGGGMFNIYSSPTLTNVTFSGNTADQFGGGIFNVFSSPDLTDVIFNGNSAVQQGGGMVDAHESNPILTNVIFTENSAANGGGLYTLHSPTLTNVTFSANSATIGGGMYSNGSATLTEVIFIGNTAVEKGGGMYNEFSNPTLTGVIFSDNSTDTNIESQGGGMYNHQSSPVLINAVFDSNIAVVGGGLYNHEQSNPTLINVTLYDNQSPGGAGSGIFNLSSSPTLTNVILWGEGPGSYPFYNEQDSNPVVSYSDIQNCGGSDDWKSYCGMDNGYNIDTDPLFVDAAAGSLHLQSGSPAIDAGDESVCPPADLEGVTRPHGEGCDMGAFEFAPPGINMSVDNLTPVPGEMITFTILVTNHMHETLTGGLISDTLPAGLNFLELITLDPPLSGTISDELPILVTDLEIGVGAQVTVTLPVRVDDGLLAGTVITNTASLTSDQLTIPVSASVSITVAEPDTRSIYLPLIMTP